MALGAAGGCVRSKALPLVRSADGFTPADQA